MPDLLGFLVFYKKSTGDIEVRQYGSLAEAAKERLKLAAEARDDDLEVASIGAESLDALARSHSRYFMRAVKPEGIAKEELATSWLK